MTSPEADRGQVSAGGRVRLPRADRSSRRRLFADRAARWVVSAGGIAVIVSVLGILVFIVLEVLPLAYPARVAAPRRVAVADGGAIAALITDEHRSQVGVLEATGAVRV